MDEEQLGRLRATALFCYNDTLHLLILQDSGTDWGPAALLGLCLQVTATETLSSTA